jgi:hydrogenase maturation protein HypF
LRKGINTVPTSSLGRVFDAVAAMLGLGSYNHFEAQLPIALEAVADSCCQESYAFEMVDGALIQLDLGPMFKAMLADVKAGQPVSIISARFHNTLAAALAAMATKTRHTTGIETVALSGGVFCNRSLTGKTINILQKNGFTVLYNTAVPANDGGLSLGQAAIAAHRFRK